jgi:hypothetical protein
MIESRQEFFSDSEFYWQLRVKSKSVRLSQTPGVAPELTGQRRSCRVGASIEPSQQGYGIAVGISKIHFAGEPAPSNRASLISRQSRIALRFSNKERVMWYISFQGESDGDINNILVYHDNGKEHSQPNLLPTGGSNPKLQELRGFCMVGNLLYVVNAHKSVSQILVYEAGNDGSYAFKEIFASMDSINSILHPYDLTFDGSGNCYVSSQDTNVVTGIQADGSAMKVAAYLQQTYGSTAAFLAGTFAASAIPSIADASTTPPPAVAIPQGLVALLVGGAISNSVRGVLYYGGYLYVADEPASAVKVYSMETGELQGQIAGSNLSAPVQLLLNGTTLYIGSTGNDSVVTYDLAQGPPDGTVEPAYFINGGVKHASGMAFDGDGYFYAADRKSKKILKFHPDGTAAGDFISGLPDDPEFILYVPKND